MRTRDLKLGTIVKDVESGFRGLVAGIDLMKKIVHIVQLHHLQLYRGLFYGTPICRSYEYNVPIKNLRLCDRTIHKYPGEHRYDIGDYATNTNTKNRSKIIGIQRYDLGIHYLFTNGEWVSEEFLKGKSNREIQRIKKMERLHNRLDKRFGFKNEKHKRCSIRS